MTVALLITSYYYLPWMSKDQSGMRAELTGVIVNQGIRYESKEKRDKKTQSGLASLRFKISKNSWKGELR